MRGDLTLKLLEDLKESSLDTVDYFMAFLTSNYGVSFEMMKHNFLKRLDKRKNSNNIEKIKSEISKEDWNKINNRFSAMLSKLQKDGLVEKSKKEKRDFIRITKKGRKKIEDLKQRARLFPKNTYQSKKSSNSILFMFDIPEVERNKRAWLRAVLIRMKFKMVQKSVWLGRVKIPEEFLNDLRKLKIIQFVEILEITKTGTIKKIP